MIRRARFHVLGDDREKTIEKVVGIKSLGLTRREIEGAYDSAIRWEHVAKSAPTTAWGLVHGLTRLSQFLAPKPKERKRPVRHGMGPA